MLLLRRFEVLLKVWPEMQILVNKKVFLKKEGAQIWWSPIDVTIQPTSTSTWQLSGPGFRPFAVRLILQHTLRRGNNPAHDSAAESE